MTRKADRTAGACYCAACQGLIVCVAQDTLRADNARLREALAFVVVNAEEGRYLDLDTARGRLSAIARNARAALADGEGGGR
jgi:hypothetical protein